MSSSWGVSLLLLIQLKKSVTRGRRHINVDSNLSLLVPYPVPAFRFIFEPVTLGIIDDYSSRLVNDDVSAVIKFGNPIFSVFFHNYFVKYVLSIALITLPVPCIVALMYGVMAL